MREEDLKRLLKERLRVAVEQYHLRQGIDARVPDDQLENFVEHHAIIEYDRRFIDGSQITIKVKIRRNFIIQVRKRKNTAQKAAKGGVGGGIAGFFGGGGAGAGIGALIGIIGGPIGVGIGLAIGAGVGATIGAVAGVTSGTGIGSIIREDDNCMAENVLPGMGRVIDNGDNEYILVEVTLNLPAGTEPIARV